MAVEDVIDCESARLLIFGSLKGEPVDDSGGSKDDALLRGGMKTSE